MKDPKAIYDELFKRTRIIEGLIRKNVNSYYDVFNVTKTFYIKGEGAISALYG